MIRRLAPPGLALLAALLVPMEAGVATPDDLRSVDAMRSHGRVLLVFAPRLDDPRLAVQRREFDRHALAMSERDLALVQVAGDEVIGARDKAERLRARHHVAPDDYRTLLIGKDGNVAMTIVGPISAQHLSERIDAMPMRQDEMRRAREGKGRLPG
jgi:hypothetical protein